MKNFPTNQPGWVKPVIFKVLIYYFDSILTTYIYEICNNLAIMIECKLDRGSIRSSPSTPYRLTKEHARLFQHVFIYMVDMHFVLPALNLSTLDAGIWIMVEQVRLMMFSLNMVGYFMSFLLLSN